MTLSTLNLRPTPLFVTDMFTNGLTPSPQDAAGIQVAGIISKEGSQTPDDAPHNFLIF